MGLLIILFLGLGAGNGSTFQLIPLRWIGTTAIAMSLVGEVGALGGGLVPNIMGYSKQYLGAYQYGFTVWGVLALGIFVMYMKVQRRWTTSWVGKGGKALSHTNPMRSQIQSADEYDMLQRQGKFYGV